MSFVRCACLEQRSFVRIADVADISVTVGIMSLQIRGRVGSHEQCRDVEEDG